ncbi:MAG: GNAT family N-acetyltransferase [Candidatus Eisenbacteria sp.]|nr:GNAT family N-acetyltransferase [Candidatus Eisenbacteria bacterium]
MPAPPSKLERPRLATRRLILAPLHPRDAGEVFAAIEESRRVLRRWLPFAATDFDVEKTRAFIRSTGRSRSSIAWGIWERDALAAARSGQPGSGESGGSPRGPRARPRRRPAGRFCGTLGMHQISLDQKVGTIGYWIRTPCTGQGHGTEACAAVLLWAFSRLRLERVAVEVASGNAPSLRVVRKLGFVREGVLRKAESIPGRRGRYDWVVLSLVRSDLFRVRGKLRAYCGTARPWQG